MYPGRKWIVLAATLGWAPWSAAGSFAFTKSSDQVIQSAGWVGNSSSIYGRGINGNSFTDEAIITFNGYQYTSFWQNIGGNGVVAVARRPTGGTWSVISVPDMVPGSGTDNRITNGPNDAHNVISLGISPNDGTIHLAYDMHGHTLRYRVGAAGVATNPAAFAWTAANATTLFPNAQRNWLTSSGSSIGGVTYPMFITTPTGNMQLAFRVGSSGSGSWWLYDYSGTTSSWTAGRQIDNGLTGTYNGTTSTNSTSRNSYPNGYTYGPDGRLHQTFVWRESATGAANHDLNYAYSDDGGTTWRNNSGAVVTAGSTLMNLNSPGLIVRPFAESQTLMNQQGQAVDADGKIHTAIWHRDSAKSLTSSVWNPGESSYFHTWRDDLGNWHESRVDGNVGGRPKIFFDASGNAVMIYSVLAGGGSLGTSLYFTNGDLVISTASKANNWNDWRVVHVEPGNFVSEAQGDPVLFTQTGTLSILMQNSPTGSGNTGTAIRSLDYSAQFTAPTQVSLATSGNLATPANLSPSVVPGMNTTIIINGGRAGVVSSALPAMDDVIAVGSGGSAGSLAVQTGADLDLLHAGPMGTTFGGSIIVGRDGSSVGNYTQSGGTVSTWRFAVGDYFSETSGGGVSTATVSGGTLTTWQLEIGLSATGTSSGSSFAVAGGSVNVNGDVIVGEFGNSATVDLSGGTLTVVGNLREGFNRTNSSTLRVRGGSLNMTGNSISADTLLLESGSISNVLAVGGGTLNKTTAGTLTLGGSNSFTNAITISAGAIKAVSSSALGSTAASTTITGGTASGALHLEGGITIAEPLILAGRQPGSQLYAHIVNTGGTNTLTGNLTTSIGGNQFTLRSDAGELRVSGSFINNQSGTAGDVRFLNLDGSGDGRFLTGVNDNGSNNNPSKTAVVKYGSGTWTLAGSNNYSGPTTVIEGRLLLSTALLSSPSVSIQSGARLELAAGGSSVLRTQALEIATGGSLLINDNDLIVDYTGASPIGLVIAYLVNGQIVVTSDASGQPTTLALAEANDLGLTTFGGRSVDGTSVIGKYTYVGDANLDGMVDALDYERIDLAIGNTGVFGTAQGDLNYDSAVDALDYEQVDLNIGNGVGVPLAGVSVPEPVGVVGLAVVAFFGRRMRSNPEGVCR